MFFYEKSRATMKALHQRQKSKRWEILNFDIEKKMLNNVDKASNRNSQYDLFKRETKLFQDVKSRLSFTSRQLDIESLANKFADFNFISSNRKTKKTSFVLLKSTKHLHWKISIFDIEKKTSNNVDKASNQNSQSNAKNSSSFMIDIKVEQKWARLALMSDWYDDNTKSKKKSFLLLTSSSEIKK